MKKNKFPIPSNIQTQKSFEVEKLKGAFNELVAQVNGALTRLENKFTDNINQVNHNIGNCVDSISALMKIIEDQSPQQSKFFKFCSDSLNIPFTQMDLDIKLNAILQFLEVNNSFSHGKYLSYVYDSFDKRNNLINLSNEEKAREGDFALITWKFTENGQVIAGQQQPSIYRLGSNSLLIDEKIKEMAQGDAQSFEVSFPDNYNNPLLKGKTGTLDVGLLRFKRQVISNPQGQQVTKLNLTQEEKKEVWKEKYKAEEIE
jgi:hypothetical protein